MARRHLLIGVLALAGLFAGCGDDPAKKVDVDQIRSVVTQFAEASDAHACDLLSPQALQDVYGGFAKSVAASKAACVKHSSKFKGQPVKIVAMKVIDPQTVRVSAENPKGNVTYTVNLGKYGPSWRIDEINQAKTEQ